MPEPMAVAVAGVALVAVFVTVASNRFRRLRQQLTTTESAIALERRRMLDAARALAALDTPPPSLQEDLAEVEDRLETLRRLYRMQTEAWNHLGRTWPWRAVRGLPGWTPRSSVASDTSPRGAVREEEAA